MPTETVYGLAGRCDNKKQWKYIQNQKRPKSNPLIIHYSMLMMPLMIYIQTQEL